MLYALIYFTWLLLPPVIIVALVRRRANKLLFGIISLVLIVLALPMYVTLPWYLAGWAWPPDIILPTETRLSTEIPGYRVDFVQAWGGDFYDTHFGLFRSSRRRP